MHAGLDLLPTWALQQKAAANRHVIAVMRTRLKRGEPVVPMYGPLGLRGCNARPRSPSSWSMRATPDRCSSLIGTQRSVGRSAFSLWQSVLLWRGRHDRCLDLFEVVVQILHRRLRAECIDQLIAIGEINISLAA
jgi:hypothetical protein